MHLIISKCFQTQEDLTSQKYRIIFRAQVFHTLYPSQHIPSMLFLRFIILSSLYSRLVVSPNKYHHFLSTCLKLLCFRLPMEFPLGIADDTDIKKNKRNLVLEGQTLSFPPSENSRGFCAIMTFYILHSNHNFCFFSIKRQRFIFTIIQMVLQGNFVLLNKLEKDEVHLYQPNINKINKINKIHMHIWHLMDLVCLIWYNTFTVLDKK